MTRRARILALIAAGVNTAPAIAIRLGTALGNISTELHKMAFAGSIIREGTQDRAGKGGRPAVRYRLAVVAAVGGLEGT